MFEKLDTGAELKQWLKKWEGKPSDPTRESTARLWTDLLGKDQDFFFATNKMSMSAFSKIPDRDKDKFQELWQTLRDNGWRYFSMREGDTPHWYTIYKKFRMAERKEYILKRQLTIDERKQEQYEKEYYSKFGENDPDFVPEAQA